MPADDVLPLCVAGEDISDEGNGSVEIDDESCVDMAMRAGEGRLYG